MGRGGEGGEGKGAGGGLASAVQMTRALPVPVLLAFAPKAIFWGGFVNIPRTAVFNFVVFLSAEREEGLLAVGGLAFYELGASREGFGKVEGQGFWSKLLRGSVSGGLGGRKILG